MPLKGVNTFVRDSTDFLLDFIHLIEVVTQLIVRNCLTLTSHLTANCAIFILFAGSNPALLRLVVICRHTQPQHRVPDAHAA